MKKNIKTKSFGYPKIGENRELKKTLENYWNEKLTKNEFIERSIKVIDKKLFWINPDVKNQRA